jgi:hypothetical protein
MDADSSLDALAETFLPRDSAAARIARGMTRHLTQRGFAAIAEVTLPNGRRADLMAIGRSGEVWIVEIKSSIEDFRVDQKWPEYRPYCDKLFFATHADVPESIFPEEAGLFLADGYDAYLVRDCAASALNAATRKGLLVLFGQLAAARLARFVYPDYRSGPDRT